MLMKFLFAILVFLLPAMAEAADVTGTPKIREGDQIVIGNSRIRLGGIDAPSVDQLCLNTKGERWTCGVAARDELIKHADNKTWTCHTRQAADRRGLARVTGPGLVVGVLDELVARGDAAGPALALGVEAKLIHRRRVDPAQPDPAIADHDLIAFADLRSAGDVGRFRHCRQQKY